CDSSLHTVEQAMSTKNGTSTLTNFKRDTSRFLKRLRRTRKPVVLTVNGKAGLVVQDAESYRELLQRLDRLETIAAKREGLDDIAAGRIRPAKEVLDDIARKYNLPHVKDA